MKSHTFIITTTILCDVREEASFIQARLADKARAIGREMCNASIWVGSPQEVSDDLAQLETLLETIQGEPVP